MPRKGLGKGLDSLIPEFYDEDFDSNSTPSLEDMLNEKDEEPQVEESPKKEEDKVEDSPKDEEPKAEESPKEEEKPKNIFEELEDEKNVEETDTNSDSDEEIRQENQQEGTVERDEQSEDISGEDSSEGNVQESQEKQIDTAHVDEVKEIVNKNPRITLWSARSSAVFRYLRKTEPEFSISKEASTLIDEAVSKKYPEIWKLFEEF
ncbi:AAA family ATPase [uncultured Methanobrevibacter sp.]|uniref:AAA family ATPase n=1 Tax=uncultured Methanobrevibacter sp. TaxID=253161 RepID=UPI0025E99021|nr:AAA family ATPase [uncultured Methanobrevibacter sp.]